MNSIDFDKVVDEVDVINIQKDDVLIFKTKSKLSDKWYKILSDYVDSKLPNNKSIFLVDDIDLRIILRVKK